MVLFTTGDILKLTGIAAATFDRWCKDGLVVPVSGGSGTGNHRQWSLTQAVGFVVAEKILNDEVRGCALKFVGSTVEAFGNVDEKWLRAQMKKVGRHYISPHFSKPMLGGDPRYGCPDVEAALGQVLKLAASKKAK